MSTSLSLERIEAVLLEAVRRGYVTVSIDPDGEARYRLTELGVKHLDEIIAARRDDQ